MRRALVVVVFLAFTVGSFAILAAEGLSGVISVVRREPWAAQMLVDLCISLFVAWLWIWRDAKEHAIRRWPYLVATLLLGSIAVLAYLIHREFAGRRVVPSKA